METSINIQIQNEKRTAGLLEYQAKTERLLKRFFNEAKILETVVNLNSFQELIQHLNPMVVIPMIPENRNEENNDTKINAVNQMTRETPSTSSNEKSPSPEVNLEELANPHPSQVNREVACILCGNAVATHKSVLLSVNETVKALMAAVATGYMTLEAAEQAVRIHPLRMCKTHINFVYDMMCKVIGVETADEVDSISNEKLMESLPIYRKIKEVRDKRDGRVHVITPVSSYKMAIKCFFKKHVTPEMAARIAQQTFRQASSYTKSVPQTLSLREYLTDENLACSIPPKLHRPEVVMHQVDFVRTTDSPPSTSTSPAIYSGNSTNLDLLYKSHERRRTTNRQKRYLNYPQEVVEMMRPIDDHFEKQASLRRVEMTQAKQRKLDNDIITTGPPVKRRPPLNMNKIVQKLRLQAGSRHVENSNIREVLTGSSLAYNNVSSGLMEPVEEPIEDFVEEIEECLEEIKPNFGLDGFDENHEDLNVVKEFDNSPLQEIKPDLGLEPSEKSPTMIDAKGYPIQERKPDFRLGPSNRTETVFDVNSSNGSNGYSIQERNYNLGLEPSNMTELISDVNHFNFMRTTDSQPSTSAASVILSDPSTNPELLYSQQQKRRETNRQRRYEIYPEELVEKMKQIDDQYEKQDLLKLAQLAQAKQGKLENEMTTSCPPGERPPPRIRRKLVQDHCIQAGSKPVKEISIREVLTGSSLKYQNHSSGLLEPNEELTEPSNTTETTSDSLLSTSAVSEILSDLLSNPDTLYKKHQKRRETIRQKRYQSYPEEVVEAMKRIDHHFEKHDSFKRFQMEQAKQGKLENGKRASSPPVEHYPPLDHNKIIQELRLQASSRHDDNLSIREVLTGTRLKYQSHSPGLLQPHEEPMEDFVEEVIEECQETIQPHFGLDENQKNLNVAKELYHLPMQERKPVLGMGPSNTTETISDVNNSNGSNGHFVQEQKPETRLEPPNERPRMSGVKISHGFQERKPDYSLKEPKAE